jgi:hypothetical protein
MALSGIIFAVVFVAFFLLRIVLATIFFYFLLPESDRCPCCDSPTIRVRSPGWNRLFPWFRTSWCYECHWEGLLRGSSVTPVDSPVAPPSSSPSRRA